MVQAHEVQELRRLTGAGMMDAKRALQEAEGDLDRAKELLREWGLASARKRSERIQKEGTIGHYLHVQAERPVIGVLVELAAETDFVAKSEDFQSCARDVAMHIAAARPAWVRRDEVPDDVVTKERELIAAEARRDGKPDNVVAKVVEGRLGTFFEEHVLYDQQFVNPARFEGTIGEWMDQLGAKLGENIGVVRFSRLAVGEGRE